MILIFFSQIIFILGPSTRESQPVCGSDGVTYGSNCALECTKEYNKALTQEYEGACREMIAPGIIDIDDGGPLPIETPDQPAPTK